MSSRKLSPLNYSSRQKSNLANKSKFFTFKLVSGVGDVETNVEYTVVERGCKFQKPDEGWVKHQTKIHLLRKNSVRFKPI